MKNRRRELLLRAKKGPVLFFQSLSLAHSLLYLL